MEWKIIFFITSESSFKTEKYISLCFIQCFSKSGGIYLFGCVIYWIWAEGEIQPWAVQDTNKDEHRSESNTQMTGFSNPALDIKE
jgi:hypothetical protein